MELFIKRDIEKNKKPGLINWKQHEFFLGREKRISTLTDVKFINKDTLVVAHRAAAELYIIKIKDNKLKIIDTLILNQEPDKTTNKDAFHPDLLCLSKNIIYINCYGPQCCEIEIKNDKLIYRKIYLLNNINIPYHCICAVNNFIYHGGCNDYDKYTILTEYNIINGKIRHIKSEDIRNIRIKTICKYKNKFIIGLLNTHRISSRVSRERACSDIFFGIYEILGDNLINIYTSEIIEKVAHDSSCIYKNYYFLTLHDETLKQAFINVYKILEKPYKFELYKKVKCNGFPHGIDIFDNKVAYTSYATSSVTVLPLNDFIDTESDK